MRRVVDTNKRTAAKQGKQKEILTLVQKTEDMGKSLSFSTHKSYLNSLGVPSAIANGLSTQQASVFFTLSQNVLEAILLVYFGNLNFKNFGERIKAGELPSSEAMKILAMVRVHQDLLITMFSEEQFMSGAGRRASVYSPNFFMDLSTAFAELQKGHLDTAKLTNKISYADYVAWGRPGGKPLPGTGTPSPLPPETQPPVSTEGLPSPDGLTTLLAQSVAPIVRDALRSEDGAITEASVKKIITEEIAKRVPHVITIKSEDQPWMPDKPEIVHKLFPIIFKSMTAFPRVNIMLIGPAGSGKTSVATQMATAIDVPFRFTGAVDSPYKLTGFVDASGQTVRTAFRETYEHGGVFLFDEIDASSAGALMAFNAALANNQADFPDGVVPRHKDFYCIAAANTFGRGADRVYVGRNALDGATLDRFAVIDFDYDETLERHLAGEDAGDWVDRVQAVRKAVGELKLRFVVSPRASIFGAALLRQKLPKKIVEEMVLWKGMDNPTRTKVKGAM